MCFIGFCPGIYVGTVGETKETSVINIKKTTKNKQLVRKKYTNLGEILYLQGRTYSGIFVIFILLHHFLELSLNIVQHDSAYI